MTDVGDDLAAELQALKQEFADKLVERLDRLTETVGVFMAAGDGTERADALGDMEEICHQLAGSGALFGFAELGDAAQVLEDACITERKTPGTAGADIRAGWDNLKTVAAATEGLAGD